MTKKSLLGLTILMSLAFLYPAWALEKLKFGTAIQLFPHYYLPVLGAEEQGFWKENGLQVEWVPFKGSTPQQQALTAGALMVGLDNLSGMLRAVAMGAPSLVIGQVSPFNQFYFWVRADRPFNEMKELSGAKFGTSRLGVPSHIYGLVAAKALGLREVKFVATGGVPESVAGLKAGVIDVLPSSYTTFVEMESKGEARRLGRVADCMPKEWVENVLLAHKEFVGKSPATLRGVIKAIIQAIAFVERNPRWTIDKMKAMQGYSEESAQRIYKMLDFTKDLKVDRKGLENVSKFLVDWGLVPREKMPPVDKIYTREFTG